MDAVLVMGLLFARLHSASAPVIVDVDSIELNHIYTLSQSTDDFGRATYRLQYVTSYWDFWSWYGFPYDDFHIRDWVKSTPQDVLTFHDDLHVLIIERRGRTFHIRGKVFRETYTLYDAEREDLRTMPEQNRRRIQGLK